MSYDPKFKGKLVWGTSVFRIDLETSHSKLKSDFSGQMTLYERRHEKSRHKFTSLEEFIATVRELWKESLRSESVQDTRLSRWIEEYFNELSVSANYQLILDAIRGEFEEAPPLEVGDLEALGQDSVNSLLPPTDEFMSRGITQKIQGGDLDDKEALDEILSNFITENKPQRKTEAISKSTFVTADGQTKTIEEKKEVVDQPMSDEVKLDSGFNNDFGVEISDISFSDTVPFDYEITDVNISGVQATKMGQEVTKDGLEVKWHLDKLAPGEESKVEYKLGKRMLRTILIRDDFDLTILQTYENINREDNSVWVESTYIFQDSTPIVENVKILDQIPGDYTLVESTPEAVPPLATINNSHQATEITWSYTDVPASTQFVLTYELANSPKLLRDKAKIFGKNDELVAQAVRLIRPEKNNRGYGVVLAIQVFKPVTNTIILRETLPLNIEVKQIDIPRGNFAELQHSDSKEIVWKVEDILEGETVQAIIHYQLDGSYAFEGFSMEIEGQRLEREETKELIKKDEKIVLPAKMYDNS